MINVSTMQICTKKKSKESSCRDLGHYYDWYISQMQLFIQNKKNDTNVKIFFKFLLLLLVVVFSTRPHYIDGIRSNSPVFKLRKSWHYWHVPQRPVYPVSTAWLSAPQGQGLQGRPWPWPLSLPKQTALICWIIWMALWKHSLWRDHSWSSKNCIPFYLFLSMRKNVPQKQVLSLIFY